MATQTDALAQFAAGHPQPAITALRAAAAQETTLPTEFGPPAIPKPTQELLGDLLLQSHHPAEALAAYQAALRAAPNRTLSLQGMLAAQHALGTAPDAAAQATLVKYVR
jgi:hypothetical protein